MTNFIPGVLHGIFTQVHGEDDKVRDNAIKFLFVNLRKLPEDTLNKDAQDYIVEECKKVVTNWNKTTMIAFLSDLEQLA